LLYSLRSMIFHMVPFLCSSSTPRALTINITLGGLDHPDRSRSLEACECETHATLASWTRTHETRTLRQCELGWATRRSRVRVHPPVAPSPSSTASAPPYTRSSAHRVPAEQRRSHSSHTFTQHTPTQATPLPRTCPRRLASRPHAPHSHSHAARRGEGGGLAESAGRLLSLFTRPRSATLPRREPAEAAPRRKGRGGGGGPAAPAAPRPPPPWPHA